MRLPPADPGQESYKCSLFLLFIEALLMHLNDRTRTLLAILGHCCLYFKKYFYSDLDQSVCPNSVLLSNDKYHRENVMVLNQ